MRDFRPEDFEDAENETLRAALALALALLHDYVADEVRAGEPVCSFLEDPLRNALEVWEGLAVE